jgi:hypothetical protein
MRVLSPRPGRVVTVLCAAALLAGCHTEAPTGANDSPAGPPDRDVTIERIKHKQLLDRLAALRGKIVVLDFWGEF